MKKSSYLLNDGLIASILIIAILVIDQIIKIEVKTNMCLGESVHVTDWFYISFIENNGMAYGMTFFNKLVLSVFRIIAVGCIGWYMHLVLKQKHSTGYIVVLSMILAGAAGNIIDSMFYGLIFNASSPFYVSYLVPFGSGYASFLQGKVVDMFYFPLIVTTYPDWVPFKGGQEFIFFSPVFNFADACISVGVVLLLLFFRKDMEGISETIKGAIKEIGMNSFSLNVCKILKMSVRSIVLVMGLLFIVSCKPSVPSKFIQPGKMEDILYDYHLASSMAQISGNDSVNTIKYRAAVLKKHGYTSAQFDSSMVYYMRHTEELKHIYEDLSKRLGDEAVALGASADAVNRFENITANGDTANVWNEESAMLLTPQKPFNLNSFSMVADSAFHKGDGIMLDFDTQFIFQDGMRDGIVVLAVKFGNDSIATQNMHISTASHFNLSIRDDKKLGIKEIRGFFMLNKSQDPGDNVTTLKLMIISNIKLYRLHQSKTASPTGMNRDSVKTSGSDSAKSSGSKPMPQQGVPIPPNSDPNMQQKRQLPIPQKALN